MRWLKEKAENQPHSRFINDLTFQQVWERTLTTRSHLSDIQEDRVALLTSNQEQSLITLFALLLLKKEVLLLNPSLTEREISEQTKNLGICQILQPEIVLTADIENLPQLDTQPADDKIAVLMNTSATSGRFKTVPITWGMITAQVKASAEVISVQPDDNWLCVLPIFHVSGLSIVMRSLYNGTQLTLSDKFDEDDILELVNSGQLNMMSLVPTQLKRLIDRLERHRLRMILLGGETIPLSLVERAIVKSLPIFKTYGMTETFSQSVTFNILTAPDKIAAAGLALPGVTLKIRQPDDQGIGEIWLNSAMLMKGYLNQPPLKDGFATGDLGYLDKDNYLYILNRRSDLIISGGENIYPKEIEDLLYLLPEISECALIAREDPTWGQIPVLYFVGNLTEDDVQNYLADKLAKFKQPKIFIKSNKLPKSPSGKILRKELSDPRSSLSSSADFSSRSPLHLTAKGFRVKGERLQSDDDD